MPYSSHLIKSTVEATPSQVRQHSQKDLLLSHRAIQGAFKVASQNAQLLLLDLCFTPQHRLQTFKESLANHNLSSVHMDVMAQLTAEVTRIRNTSTLFEKKQEIAQPTFQFEHMTAHGQKQLSFEANLLLSDTTDRNP